MVPVSGVFFFFFDDGSLSVGWFGLHGFAPVGRLHYAGQRGLEFVGLLHLCFICFHQKRDDSVQKNCGHPYHLPRELRQNRVYLNVWVPFLK